MTNAPLLTMIDVFIGLAMLGFVSSSIYDFRRWRRRIH